MTAAEGTATEAITRVESPGHLNLVFAIDEYNGEAIEELVKFELAPGVRLTSINFNYHKNYYKNKENA